MVIYLGKLQYLLVAVRTDARRLVVFGTIIVGTVVKGSVPFANWSAPSLVHKVPVEADERSMLVTFVLEERLALFDTEFFEVSAKGNARFGSCWMATVHAGRE